MSGLAQYRKRPVVIEAMQFDGSRESAAAIIDWAKVYAVELVTAHRRLWVDVEAVWVNVVHIPTLEGTMTASPGDWVIKGVEGEFYPCKPDIFTKTYELEI